MVCLARGTIFLIVVLCVCVCVCVQDGKKVRRQVLASLLAAGVAINLAAGAGPAAFAASGPGTDGAERTARKAGELLQDADKLIKNDSPPSYGPGRVLEGAAENIERFSQQ
jgi:hypothetical protein